MLHCILQQLNNGDANIYLNVSSPGVTPGADLSVVMHFALGGYLVAP